MAKGNRACNYISGISLSASKKSMQNPDWQDDISNDVIIPSACAFTCFSFFVYIHAHFSFTLIGRNLTAQLP